MPMSAVPARRRAAIGLLLGGATIVVAPLVRAAPREIRISAARFHFRPEVVALRLGEPVVLVFVTEDRIHGFKAPGLELRAELVPGQEARLAFTPTRKGRFAYFCDVFCGDGHDEMEGTIVVEG